MEFKLKLAELLAEKTKLTLEKVEDLLEVPPKSELGDFAFPCFVLGGNPKEKAEEIASKVGEQDFLQEVKVVGPYVNFFLKTKKVAEVVLNKIKTEKKNYGKVKSSSETVMIEFFHANTHKGVHIGHIRNISLGSAIANLLDATGRKVIRVNYQGDIGPHVAKCLWAYLHFKEKEPTEHKGIWLGKLYAKGSTALKKNEALDTEVKDINTKIYQKDSKIVDLWEKTRQWCLDDFDAFYADFGVKFDRFYFESEAAPEGKTVFEKLLKQGVARESDGAIIVDLTEYDLDVYVGITGRGNPTYQGKELGLAEIKQKEYTFDKSLHIVGSEQNLFFKQVFKTYELMKSPMAQKSYHVSYGLVMLPEGKMSSRDGTMILYHDLFQKLVELAKKEITKRHGSLSEEEIEKRAKSISFGALKYGMISRENHKDLVFDWERALDFEGNTGPYIQYAHARCSSILRKSNVKFTHADSSQLVHEKERALFMLLGKFEETVRISAEQYRPYVLANYLFDLSQAFNEFYHACHVLTDDEELSKARLLLVDCTRQVLENGLNLLGIDAPQEM